ncbi:4-hydroxythreonine-4-phosphate dehydrogenase PdxA [Blochmannia endosymbiont of Camponotus sp. C-003]|uniref:4-hydroxythreonine-4-phosphate dehydrogenase PdxA n=1 Tax=unclassified Candidatus Blochmanniella TaxID=711328 RepID=UPI0020255C5B|nr:MULTISPECIES: 4-hydroxythreonine-4-phosphate dehydrogenase PdxA [unclassified Candidatus Blochmannia]URJ23114.1 4-hydroxythreonine-4-phosphate dehydrogenase PdxA [Blochmannia endosymbiont of Camponotus sp. C-003]URJ28583.1 4-hydroxythreonine-4-phosphate dehydrogenase PdxA [Blochmannia endosymbiont of Camponotus sp. C-046]
MKKKNKRFRRIVITTGEPAGIGPDIIIMSAQKKWPVELVVCADPNLLLDRAKQINVPLRLRSYHSKKLASPCVSGELSILKMLLPQQVTPGQLNVNNNNYVIDTLTRASQGCLNGEFSALVTGPVHKAILNKGNITFSGHTEFLSHINKCKTTVMMLINSTLRVALATTHIPILSVPKMITQQSLCDTIPVLAQGLKKYFGIAYPKIYVCGLNPHSGESGYIGQEEIKIIIPALNILKKNINYELIGPLSADTIFQKKYMQHADVILTMYHDQGLPVLKYSGFGQSVNVTLGLPFIRTSVDHGTALELSGTGQALPDSMIMAITVAIEMINNLYAKKIL